MKRHSDSRAVEDGGSRRLFVAVVLPEDAQAALLAQCRAWGRSRELRAARWVHAFHVTLRFLGAVASEMVADVSGAVRDAVKRMPSFGVSPGGLGAFPRPTRATVLWCGVDDGAAALAECARRVEEALRALRFVPERRPFVPHVTLARLRAPQDLSAWLAAQGASATAPLFPAFPAVQVSLMESQLGPGGAVHSPVAVYPLG